MAELSLANGRLGQEWLLAGGSAGWLVHVRSICAHVTRHAHLHITGVDTGACQDVLKHEGLCRDSGTLHCDGQQAGSACCLLRSHLVISHAASLEVIQKYST